MGELVQRPSGLLVPRGMSPAEARARILAGHRLAGAGGSWQLFVPPQSYQDAVPTSEGWATFPAFAINQGNTPTLMSEWAIQQIYVPAGFYSVNPAAKEKTIVSARLTMLRQGDIVAVAEIEQEAHEPEGVYPATVLNTVFAINPPVPVPVRARQLLTLQLSVFWAGSLSYVSRRAYLSQQVGKLFPAVNNNPETLIASAGTVSYDEANLAGRRSL